ncbi:DEAD-box ATP-dependent RNA helicase 21-like isoform X2 [Tripterygium wilfordii]|uniref:DEAD-box ATP-dependent RNA helicase 21-like isoform X2 n=1 Tax=Tripterygium wilfordii TaxID=458696 RepID=A0A7J7BXI1_TRIWF|nr:DEAD-box ATP-dependent RNA helicase 21-like isoform X2 [Tripterygium wilfordii]
MKRPFDDVSGSNFAGTNTTKPVFLTKVQRQQLAFERRQDLIERQKKRQDAILSKYRPSDSSSHKSSDSGRSERDRESNRDRDRERERGRRRARESDRESEMRKCKRALVDLVAESERRREKLAQRELQAIKEQYLGYEKPKKREIKTSQKFRLSFDWENTEDTSRDIPEPARGPALVREGFSCWNGSSRAEEACRA